MLLDRAHVTIASRVMLPAYIALCCAFGVVYVLDPLGRNATNPALAYQRSALPMPVWGCMFLLLAAGMVGALVAQRRMLFAFALGVCAAVWVLWGALYIGSIVVDPRASVLGPVLPWFVATASTASMLSLLAKEW